MTHSKNSLFVLLVLLLTSLTADAQDFDLYYAKNVTDATQFSDLKLLDKELTWRKMDKEAIDVNQDEVAAVTEMLRWMPTTAFLPTSASMVVRSTRTNPGIHLSCPSTLPLRIVRWQMRKHAS